MTSPLKEQWNEFDWERELRKDDARVNAYFSELPRYIDLPAEDEIIYHNIRRKKSLAPTGGDWPFHLPAEKDPPPDEDDPEIEEERRRWGEEWQKREGADSYILCGRLTRLLCVLFAEKSADDAMSRTVSRMLCLTGKTMARMTDIIELEPGELPALRIALGKRFLADVNEMLGMLDGLVVTDIESMAVMKLVSDTVFELREQVLKIMDNARNGGSKGPSESSKS